MMKRLSGEHAALGHSRTVGRTAALLALILALASTGCDTGGDSNVATGLVEQVGTGVANALSSLIEAGLLTAVL